MAQKSKPAAKPARSEKQSGKKSKVKPTTKAVKAKAKSVAPVTKASGVKVLAKTASTKPTKSAAAHTLGEKQIHLAKAALKKQSAEVAEAPARSEAKPRGRKISIEISGNEAASSLAAKWTMLHKKAEQIEAKPYNMKGQFEERTAINHKVLGWGYILTNRNDRLEVLFKDGIKYLISNYKG